MYKKRVLRIIDTLNLETGGPAQGIKHSSEDFANKGIGVDIITSDISKKKYLKKKNIKILKFGSPNLIGSIIYLTKLFFYIFRNKKKYRIVLVHGIWGFKTSICRLLVNNYAVFVHGSLHRSEFKKGYLKNLKKIIFWHLLEKRNLLKSKFVILTSDKEKKSFYNTYFKTRNIKTKFFNYGILENKIDSSKACAVFKKKLPNLKSQSFYLYLGRVHPQKGCDILIRSMIDIKSKLLIMGNFSNDNYKNYLHKIIRENKMCNIVFAKADYSYLKWGALLECKALVSATHGENFGISLVEAMSCKKPVITTNKVNISDKIINDRAGIISSVNLKSFRSSIKKFEKFNSVFKVKMGKNAYKCFQNNFDLKNSKNSLTEYIKNFT